MVKKYLPLILLLVGLLVFGGVYFFAIRGRSEKGGLEEEALMELPLEKRPIAKLIPSVDGHWLKLVVEKINVEGAVSMDYELLYKFPDMETGEERTAGVPGTIMLTGQSAIERDLLMGSESSGKFRYDEGVKEGTLTLRFRNDNGKLIAKLSTGFHLQKNEKELTDVDGKFTHTLDSIPQDVYFVTMSTFGIGDVHDAFVRDDVYAIFASSNLK